MTTYDMPSEPRPWLCDRTGQAWHGYPDGWRRGGHADDEPLPWRTLLAEFGPLVEKPSDEEAREYATAVLEWAAKRMLTVAEASPTPEDRRAAIRDCAEKLRHWAYDIERCNIAPPIGKDRP